MQVRTEEPGDRAAVLDVHRRAFGDRGPVVAGLAEALRPGALSLVAEEDGRIVGSVMATRGLLDAPRRLVPVQVLSPLGVLPERQGRGIGSALVRRCADVLDERREPLLFLEGDPGYYSRLGFTAAGGHGFRKPSLRIPDAAFQVRILSGYEPWMTGTLVYAQVFWDHDCVGLREI